MRKRTRAYFSCYSCPHSTILTNGKDKMIQCGLSDNRITKLKAGMHYPEWCERRKANHERVQ